MKKPWRQEQGTMRRLNWCRRRQRGIWVSILRCESGWLSLNAWLWVPSWQEWGGIHHLPQFRTLYYVELSFTCIVDFEWTFAAFATGELYFALPNWFLPLYLLVLSFRFVVTKLWIVCRNVKMVWTAYRSFTVWNINAKGRHWAAS